MMILFYLILAGAILYFSILLWKHPSDWGYASLAVLIGFLCIWILIDHGKLYRYELKAGDKIYKISASEFDTLIKKNLDNIGQAIINIYEKYSVMESVYLQKEPEKWKLEKTNNKLFLLLKLQHEPILNTLEIKPSAGSPLLFTKEDHYESGYFYILLEGNQTKKGFQDFVKQTNLHFEIRYLRKAEI